MKVEEAWKLIREAKWRLFAAGLDDEAEILKEMDKRLYEWLTYNEE